MSGIPAGSPPGEPGGKPAQTATRVFVDHRGLLFSIVYNMLGSVADTEDVLQETWLAWVARTQAASGELIAARAHTWCGSRSTARWPVRRASAAAGRTTPAPGYPSR